MPHRMNDPHVVALVFKVEHGRSVAYRDDAPPIKHEEDAFRVVLEAGTVRLEFKEHHATEEGALEGVQAYIRNWELDADLRGHPGDFKLRFQRAEVIDRDPPPRSEPGFVDISASGIAALGTLGSATATVVKPSYPEPPAGLSLKADDPDVSTMYNRLAGYYSRREPLPSMAYFCLTMLERHFTGNRSVRRTATGGHYHIDVAILDEVGELSSTKGGVGSGRKAGAAGAELSRKEARFLEGAIKQIIRRVAEVAHNPAGAFPTITLADLPDLS